jgi:hypothetical protein
LAMKYSKIGFADSEFAPSLLTHSWTSIKYKLDITTWIEVMYRIGSARSVFQITFEDRFNDAESVQNLYALAKSKIIFYICSRWLRTI